MGNVPSERNALFAFAQGHYAIWLERYATIGVSQQLAQSVKTATEAVSAATLAANEARTASRAATSELSTAYRALRMVISEAVRTINDFAEASSDPQAIFDKAMIDAPQPRGEAPPPSRPYDLTVTLNPTTGSLLLKWRAVQPPGVSGVVYRVMRAIGAGGEYDQIGLVGEKTMVDASIPAGTAQLSYNVVAQRGGQTSLPSVAIDVRFGLGAGGQIEVSSISEAA